MHACTVTVESLAVKGSDLIITDPLNDVAALEWNYDGRRTLNTAQPVYYKIEENGLVTVTNLLDAGSLVCDTELPEGFSEIKMMLGSKLKFYNSSLPLVP